MSNSADPLKFNGAFEARGKVVSLSAVWSDAALVAALLARDERAAVVLFDRYGAHVERVVARVLGPDPDIADLVQDVFAVAITTIHRLEDPASLKAWLTRMAVFKTRTHIRNRRRWRFVTSLPFYDLPELPATSVAFHVSEAVVAVYEVLQAFSAEERICFTLRFIDGMELIEVADACDVSLSTIKRRIKSVHQKFTTSALREPRLRDWLGERTS